MSAARWAYLATASISLIFACGALWIALSHNPQGEFYGSELGTDWPHIAFLFATSFLLSFLPLSALAWLILSRMKSKGEPR